MSDINREHPASHVKPFLRSFLLGRKPLDDERGPEAAIGPDFEYIRIGLQGVSLSCM
jgi:hypothetical protein